MANTFNNPKIYSMYLARNLDANAVAVPLVSRSVEADLAKFGDTVYVDKHGDVTVGNYTIGSNITVTDVTSTQDSLVLNTSKYFAFAIDDLEQARYHHDIKKAYMKRAAIAMGLTLDTSVLAQSANVSAGNIIGSASAPVSITPDNVYEYFMIANQLLREDNVINGEVDYGNNLKAVVDPDTVTAIMRSPEWEDTSRKQDLVEKASFRGHFAGFEIHESNNIATSSNVKDIMFFHPEFISLAVRVSPNPEVIRDKDQFRDIVRGLTHYGLKVFNPTMGVVIKKASAV